MTSPNWLRKWLFLAMFLNSLLLWNWHSRIDFETWKPQQSTRLCNFKTVTFGLPPPFFFSFPSYTVCLWVPFLANFRHVNLSALILIVTYAISAAHAYFLYWEPGCRFYLSIWFYLSKVLSFLLQVVVDDNEIFACVQAHIYIPEMKDITLLLYFFIMFI